MKMLIIESMLICHPVLSVKTVVKIIKLNYLDTYPLYALAVFHESEGHVFEAGSQSMSLLYAHHYLYQAR